MAKFTYGPIVSDARNKLAGVVFSRSRSGPYGRSKVSPTQPRSSYQANVRANFTTLTKLWGDTSMNAYRAGWISLAERYPVKDVFGNTRTLTGLQMFLKCNRALQALETGIILPAPASLVCSSPGNITVTPVAGAQTIAITVTYNPSPFESPVIWAAAPSGAGVSRVGAHLRQIKFLANGAAGPYAAGASYVAKYGAWAVGKRIFVAVRYTENYTGAQGGISSADAIST